MSKEEAKAMESEGSEPAPTPDSEVASRPVRRRFTAEQKLRILRQADACGHGELGALLRREGLYSSHLETWRRQRERGELEGLAPKTRGRKPAERNPLASEVAKLQRENARLQHRLKQAELIISFQKKLSLMLNAPPDASEDDVEKTR